MGRKLGGAVPPSDTKWPGLRPTSMPTSSWSIQLFGHNTPMLQIGHRTERSESTAISALCLFDINIWLFICSDIFKFLSSHHIFRRSMMQNMQLWPKIIQDKASEMIPMAWMCISWLSCFALNIQSVSLYIVYFAKYAVNADIRDFKKVTRMWANAQRNGHPAEYRWRPLFNTAKFGWCPLLECRAVTLPRGETRWNLQGAPNSRTDLSR